MPAVIAIADPRLDALEQQGYRRVDMAGFAIGATTGDMAFGSPYTHNRIPQLVSGALAYLQYVNPETQDCVLVFARAAGAGYRVLDTIAASQVSDRLQAMLSPGSDYELSPVFCSPQGWGDANDNGLPDFAVTSLRANQYTGSDAHLFEVALDDTVRDLFADLPGIASLGAHDPSDPVLTVFDLQWAIAVQGQTAAGVHGCVVGPTWRTRAGPSLTRDSPTAIQIRQSHRGPTPRGQGGGRI